MNRMCISRGRCLLGRMLKLRPRLLVLAGCLVVGSLTAGVLMTSGCGDDNSVKPDDHPLNTLVFKRADNSTITFPARARAYVWCGPWEEDYALAPTIHVLYAAPEDSTAYWYLQAVLADVVLGDTLRFPNTYISDQPDSASLFILDAPNELSTAEEESSGYLVFESLPCGKTNLVEFNIDAVVGSEYGDMTPASVKGQFRASATGEPSW